MKKTIILCLIVLGIILFVLFDDTTPPVISAVSVSNVYNTGADITWQTNEFADVDFFLKSESDDFSWHWKCPRHNQWRVGTNDVEHKVYDMPKLNLDTKYSFEIVCTDNDGNKTSSGPHYFTTTSSWSKREGNKKGGDNAPWLDVDFLRELAADEYTNEMTSEGQGPYPFQ